MENVDLFEDIKKKIPNIVSHFRFLAPMTTSAEEKAVLDKGRLVVEDLGEQRFGLTFHLPDYLFIEIAPMIPSVEESLMNKSASVFKYFEGAKVLFVKVNRNNQEP